MNLPLFWRLVANEILNISTVNEYDYICLVATYTEHVTDGKNSVSSELVAKGYSAEAIAQVKKAKAKKFTPISVLGLRFTAPFDHLKFDLFDYLYTLFVNYERGCLPFQGSVSEQPAQIMEYFSILEALRFESTRKETSKSNVRNQHKNQSRARR